MHLKLTTWQRLTLVGVLSDLRGPVAIIRKASKLLDILELSAEEKEEIGLHSDAPGAMRWTNNDYTWNIEVKDKELARFLKGTVEQHKTWPAANAGQVLDLADQLDID